MLCYIKVWQSYFCEKFNKYLHNWLPSNTMWMRCHYWNKQFGTITFFQQWLRMSEQSAMGWIDTKGRNITLGKGSNPSLVSNVLNGRNTCSKHFNMDGRWAWE
jgi:hypothetical protein